jgi:hypothetical protein
MDRFKIVLGAAWFTCAGQVIVEAPLRAQWAALLAGAFIAFVFTNRQPSNAP